MLDIRRIRKNADELQTLLKRRSPDISLDMIIQLDKIKREKIILLETMKSEHNRISKLIRVFKTEKKDSRSIINDMRNLSSRIKNVDREIKDIDSQIELELLKIPNIPNYNIPIGKSYDDNKEVRRWGNPRNFCFQPHAHWDLGVELGLLDFKRATKIAGTRFVIFKEIGALLERALITYMLNKHIFEQGFTEISPPYIVNEDSMIGTGQLPKFKDEMFKLNKKDYYLIPTAEVPITNIYRNEIMDIKDLPMYMTAYTPCFRAETGSAGRDTKGLIRNHQFDKVEMVMYSAPDDSYRQLELLVGFAEDILKGLKLPYRVVELCTGEIGFSSAKTYDLEVWMPSYNRYVEISSCSNFEDFQARRANIKFKNKEKNKPEFIHTLNGSGLAVGRTFAAILENYQNEDGTVTVPDELRVYMNGIEKIEHTGSK